MRTNPSKGNQKKIVENFAFSLIHCRHIGLLRERSEVMERGDKNMQNRR